MAKKYLVISPHPDDLDFGCGGTIAKLTTEGAVVEELIISDGSKGSHKTGFGGKKLARIREQEQRKAAAVLGVQQVRFLGKKDGELENTKALRKELVHRIRQAGPDVLISFDPSCAFDSFYRSHRDHRMAAEAVFDAVYPATGSSSFFPGVGPRPHQIGELWFFAASSPDKLVDISATLELKIRALLCHESQIAKPEELQKRIRERARDAANGKKTKYAEAFRVLAF